MSGRGTNKYHAIKADCDQGGVPHRHDSRKERDRCFVLHQWQALGAIRDLQRQPAFPLTLGSVPICVYRADFSYFEPDPYADRFVVEDTKGYRTPEYRIKKRLMRACYQIEVRET